MDMRRSIIALLSFLVTLIGQSAGATNYDVFNKFEAVCRFNTFERCHGYTLPSPDVAHALERVGHSTYDAAPRSGQTARSKNKLARGGPLHLYRSSAGKLEHERTQPAQRKK
jgi:hypothetical protein